MTAAMRKLESLKRPMSSSNAEPIQQRMDIHNTTNKASSRLLIDLSGLPILRFQMDFFGGFGVSVGGIEVEVIGNTGGAGESNLGSEAGNVGAAANCACCCDEGAG